MDLVTTKLLAASGGAGARGDEAWVARWYGKVGTNKYTEPTGIVADSNGVYISGRSNDLDGAYGQNSYNGFWFKLSSDGTQINWFKTSEENNFYHHLMSATSALMPNGNIVFAGYIKNGTHNARGVLYQINPSNGNVVWRTLFDAYDFNDPKSVKVDVANNIFVSGWTGMNSQGGYGTGNVWKFDSNHGNLWRRYYGSLTASYTGSVESWAEMAWCDVDSNGDVYLSGSVVENQSVSTQHRPSNIAKINYNGVEQWKRKIYGSSSGTENVKPFTLNPANNGLLYYAAMYKDNNGNSEWVIVYLSTTLGTTVGYQRTTLYGTHTISIRDMYVEPTTRDMWIIALDGSGKMYIYKLDSNFTLQWASGIVVDSSVKLSGNYDTPMSGMFLDSNENLYFNTVGYADKCHVFKIPTTGLVAGTYGAYTITDESSTWGIDNSNFTLNNVSALIASPSAAASGTPGNNGIAYHDSTTHNYDAKTEIY